MFEFHVWLVCFGFAASHFCCAVFFLRLAQAEHPWFYQPEQPPPVLFLAWKGRFTRGCKASARISLRAGAAYFEEVSSDPEDEQDELPEPPEKLRKATACQSHTHIQSVIFWFVVSHAFYGRRPLLCRGCRHLVGATAAPPGSGAPFASRNVCRCR